MDKHARGHRQGVIASDCGALGVHPGRAGILSALEYEQACCRQSWEEKLSRHREQSWNDYGVKFVKL